MKRYFFSMVLSLSAGAVLAAPLSVAPQAGQWQITTQTFAEGKDIGPQLQLIKQQAAALLKPEQLKKLENYDPARFTECLTPKQAAVLRDPQQSLAFLQQALGDCELQLDEQGTDHLHFSGVCHAPKHGVSGQVKGFLHYQSSQHASGYVEGLGTLPPPIQLILIGKIQPEVQIRNEFKAQWQQATCLPR